MHEKQLETFTKRIADIDLNRHMNNKSNLVISATKRRFFQNLIRFSKHVYYFP